MPGQAEGTNTFFFVDKANALVDRCRDVTYSIIVLNYRPEKDDSYRVRLIVGGDRIICPWDCGTPTVDILTFKILLNSIVLTPKNKCYRQH